MPSETLRLASTGKAAKISANTLRGRIFFIFTPIVNYLYATYMPKKLTLLTYNKDRSNLQFSATKISCRI
jgi:hypothetical protein